MASQMLVPASKDTLFMRGFSAKHQIQEIREFFTDEGGRCTVEFFKEADTKDRLYVALRFDTKDIAKEVLNRFDNTDIMGDRVTISWFKDLRRARAKEMARRQQRGWSPQRNNYWDRGSRYDQNRRWRSDRSPVGTRYRKYDRSSSRSRSPSRSPSSRRSYSRSRSRSPSIDRNRSRTPERSSKKHRSGSNSKAALDKQRSISESQQERGRDRDRSASTPRKEEKMDLEKSNISRDDIEGRWRDRSPERSPARSPSREKFSDRGSEPRRSRGEDQVPEPVRYDNSPPRLGKQVRSAVTTVDPAVQKSPPSLGAPEGDTYQEPKKEYREEERPYKQEREFKQEREYKQPGRFYDEPPYNENSKFSGDRETQASRRRGDHYADNYKSGHDGYQDYDQERSNPSNRPTTFSPNPGPGREPAADDRAGPQDPVSPPYHQEDPGFRRREEEFRGDPRRREIQDIQPMERDRSPEPPRQKRVYDDDFNRMPDREFEDRRGARTEDLATDKKRKFEDPGTVRESRRDQFEERVRPPSSTKSSSRQSRYREDVASLPEEGRSVGSGPVNGGLGREVDRGTAGLPQDKLLLVKEKKEEIEKSYRQDCETFAAVVKMLISKDPTLEDKLQHSLRENLKEIGQRCIYELREFMDRVKLEDESRR